LCASHSSREIKSARDLIVYLLTILNVYRFLNLFENKITRVHICVAI